MTPAAADPSAAYWDACRARIAPFVRTHFRWPGVWALHRAAFGLDLLKAPVNVLLVFPGLLTQLLAVALRGVRARRWARRLHALPLGFSTAVERRLGDRLRHELLALDGQASARGELERVVESLIARYAETRRAAADVTTALVVGTVGWVLFDRFTPGSISAGQELAARASHYAAVHDFFLGATVGSWYYRLFPPATEWWAVAAAVLVVALAMAVTAAFAGLVADPLQARLGVHQRRLRRWLDTARRLSGGEARGYRPLDPYMARLVDLVDAVKGVGSV